MRVLILPDGTVRLTRPKWMPKILAEKLAKGKELWIRTRLTDLAGMNRSLSGLGRGHYLANKEMARECIERKAGYWSRFYGWDYGRISIRNQKTRWGSCSRKGNLNFNYKLAFLPDKLGDYIVVHELCHLREMNHSQKFWTLVARAVPDYRNVRKKLKGYAI